MQTITLLARNNQTFQLTLDMTAWEAVIALETCVLHCDVRLNPTDTNAALSFSSNSADGVPGSMTFNATTKILVMSAPKSAVSGLSGDYQYDAKLIAPGGDEIDMFGGVVTFAPGISR